MPTSVELRQRAASVWERMKEITDNAETEDRNLTAEEESNYSQASKDVDDLLARAERQEKIERTPADPGTRIQDPEQRTSVHFRDSEQYRDAYRNWLRFGEAISVEERQVLAAGRRTAPTEGMEARALATVNASAGGYMVAPNGFGASIESAMSFYGGMLESATIIDTDDGADLPFPTSNDTSNTGERVPENAAITEQDITVGQVLLKAFMYSSKLVKVPYQLVQDSAFDIEAFLADKFGERIGRVHNTDFTIGTGANSPTGITRDTVQGKAAATGQSTTVTWDDLIDLEHSVNVSYRNGARYMFHDSTLQALRKIKDGEGRYLWQPGTTANAPALVNGYAYHINNDIPAMAASANSILFGQLKKYHIRRVRGFTLLRLQELYAANMQVGFFAYARADGKLIDAGGNPVKHYTNSAS